MSDASHELRSPVTVIRAQLEVALRRGDNVDWPVVAERVLAEDDRLEQTITELLELARVDENGDVTDFTEIDLDELVLEEVARVRGVGVDVSHVSAGRVLGRPQQLARVVHNLLDNARRHADNAVAVSLEERDGVVELLVDDDGPGIAPEDRERVFERFTRLDEGRARDAGGMGLGLALVKATVERHGGTVTIDEAPLGGACFAVRLPAHSPASPSGGRDTGRDHSGRRAGSWVAFRARCPSSPSSPSTRTTAAAPSVTAARRMTSGPCSTNWPTPTCSPFRRSGAPTARRAWSTTFAARHGYDERGLVFGRASVARRWPGMKDDGEGTIGLSVLSRLPMRAVGEPAVGPTWRDPVPDRRVVHVEVDVDGTPLQLVAVHISSQLPYAPPMQLRRLGPGCSTGSRDRPC